MGWCIWFFQFMPSTIESHAVDYNKDNHIDLKNSVDAYASAANYLNNMGWNKDASCFYKVNLKKDISDKYLNVSAKKIHSKKNLNILKIYN